MAPRIKAPASGFPYRENEGRELDFARGGNKAIEGETINTSCQFTYSVFNLFLHFISLQILSVCLTYILYIFIYQYKASL